MMQILRPRDGFYPEFLEFLKKYIIFEKVFYFQKLIMNPPPPLLTPAQLAATPIEDAQLRIFHKALNAGAIAARAMNKSAFTLTGDALPEFVSAEFCDRHMPPGYEWSFTPTTITEAAVIEAELRVTWLA